MRVLFIVGLGLVAFDLWSPVPSPALVVVGATLIGFPLYVDAHYHRPGPFLRFLDHMWRAMRALMLWPFEVASDALDRVTRTLPPGPPPAPPRSTCRHEGEPVPVEVHYPEMGLAPERTEVVAYLCPECRETVPTPFKPPPMMALGSITAEGPTGRVMLLPEGVTYTPLGGQVEPDRAVRPVVRPRTPTWSKPGPGGIVKGPGACTYCHTPHHRYDGTHACRCAGCSHGDSIDAVDPAERQDALQMLREDLAAKVEQIKAIVAGWDFRSGPGAAVLSDRGRAEYRKRLAEVDSIRCSIEALEAAAEPPPRNAVVSVDQEPEGTECHHCGEPFEFEDVMSHGSHVPVRRIRRPHMCQVDVEDPETGEHLGEVRYIAVGDLNLAGGPDFSDHLRRTLFPPL